MTPPTYESIPDRNPLTVEEFGHLVASAFDNQPLLLSFPEQERASLSLQNTSPTSHDDPFGYSSFSPYSSRHPSISPDLYSSTAADASSPVKSRPSRVSSTFKWLTSQEQNPGLDSASSSSSASPVTPRTPHDLPPITTRFQSGWSSKKPMSVLGSLKTKMSLERLPTRRNLLAAPSPLSPTDVHNFQNQSIPRPAPFFYAQSSPDPSKSSSMDITEESQSAESINSAEIRSWKLTTKTKKSKSSKSLRELFRLGGKADVVPSHPPVPSFTLDAHSYAVPDSDPFAATTSPVSNSSRQSLSNNEGTSPLVAVQSLSPDLSLSESVPVKDSSFDSSRSKAHHSPRTQVMLPTDQPTNHLAVKPVLLSPISAPRTWILDAENVEPSVLVPSLVPLPLSGHATPLGLSLETSSPFQCKTPTAQSASPSPQSIKRRFIAKARSFSNSSQTNSSSSHSAPSNCQSYHTATSGHSSSSSTNSAVSSQISHSQTSPKELPPSAFKLSSPPKRMRRLPVSKSPQHQHRRAKLGIPDMWTNGSISGVDVVDIISSPVSPQEDVMRPAPWDISTPNRRRNSEESLSTDREGKSSNEGSFETAYTRPWKGHRHSLSFDAVKNPMPNIVPSAVLIQEVANAKPMTESKSGSSLDPLDSFTTTAKPIDWPLPPRLTLLVDTNIGEKWKNVSPVQEYFSRGSPPIDPGSRHTIHYRATSSSTSLPLKESRRSPTIPRGGGGGGSTPPSLRGSRPTNPPTKPLPRRPVSFVSYDGIQIASPTIDIDTASSSPMSPKKELESDKSVEPGLSLSCIRIYLGGQKLLVRERCDMPTIFFLCPGEEEHLHFESRNWNRLNAFCLLFKDVTIRAGHDEQLPGAYRNSRTLYISVLEVRSKVILRLSLEDTMFSTEDAKPVMKHTLSMPTTLEQVVEKCKQVPIGHGL